jgi:nitrite reductase/ring-hydroxylating ferredoxin subunit
MSEFARGARLYHNYLLPIPPMTKQRVCELNDLDRTGAKGVILTGNSYARELLLVLKIGYVYAYENRYPHKARLLDWMPDQFLDEDGELIVCARHAAMFRTHDGRCVTEPCTGATLRAVEIMADDGAVFLNES